MIIRAGLPSSTGALPLALERRQDFHPALLSAGSLWVPRTRRFRRPGDAIDQLDVALDSSGFVRMRGGGYPWAIEQYVELAGRHSWAWWAQMDLPCEPELASDQEAVRERQEVSRDYLVHCKDIAWLWRERGADWLLDPMPVLQGWAPDDYLRCADLYDEVLDGSWPELVGVGSMCRRHLRGPAGLIAVLRALETLPAQVQLHLFGVKGSALDALRGNPRIASVDSQAWGVAARRRARKEGRPCSMDLKRQEMARWLDAQQPAQPMLWDTENTDA